MGPEWSAAAPFSPPGRASVTRGRKSPGAVVEVRRLIRLAGTADAGHRAGAGASVGGQLHDDAVGGHVVPDDRPGPVRGLDLRPRFRRLLLEVLVERVLVLQAAHQPAACPGD